MRVSGSFMFMFGDISYDQKYEKAAKLGFKLIEAPVPYDIEPEVLKSQADMYGLQHILINSPMGDFAGGERGFAAKSSKKKEYLESLDLALKYAKILGVKFLHLQAGNTDDPFDLAYRTYVENVKIAAEKFGKEGIIVLLEPVNSHYLPTYFMNSIDLAARVIEEVNSPHVKIMYDVFHIQQIHGQLTALLKKYSSLIGHIQMSQISEARGEPNTPGEVNFKYLFNIMKEVNPTWIIGAEYKNTSETLDSVRWVHEYGFEF